MVPDVTDVSHEQERALKIAAGLALAGAPIFSAHRNSSSPGEFLYPNGWQTTRAGEQSLNWINRWRPGMALCMVTGVLLDVIDVDPRNGGLKGVAELEAAGALPPTMGRALTPSAGQHLFIPRTHLAKGKPAQGIDLQAGADDGTGRGFVFLAPTVRPSKYGESKGLDVAYAWDLEPDLDDDTMASATGSPELRQLIILASRGKAPKGKARPPAEQDDSDAFYDEAESGVWTRPGAQRVIEGQIAAVAAAREGEINNALGGGARVLGRFVAGAYLTEDVAVSMLLEALKTGGVHSDSWNVANGKSWTAATCIGAGLARGAEEPWTVQADPVVGQEGDGPAVAVTGTVAPNQAAPARTLPSPGMPTDVARELLASYPEPLTWWKGDFYRHAGTHWESAEEVTIRGWVRLATERATYLKPKKVEEGAKPTFEVMNWSPTISKVREVVAALGEGVLQRAGDDDRVLALENGVLRDVPGRQLAPHSPAVFNLTSRPFPYVAGADAPAWTRFLGQVLPDADDDRAFLQEWFGYVLSGRTDIHAIASLAGASRSGKGTILRVLTAMTGTENVAAGRLDVLAGQFGMESLIGKSLLAFGDVRWNNSNAQVAIQQILEISGEDKVTVPRKNRTDWQGTLGVRVMFAGNEIPRFSDPSRAMANRLRIVRFTQSFAGREDHGLTRRLLEELPGILNWALDGLDRLTAAGRFTESARSRQLRERVGDGGDAVTAFADEYLEPDAGAWCFEDDLVKAYEEWCERTRRRRDSATAETLRSSVLDLFPEVTNGKETRRSKRTESGPRRVRAFNGLRLVAAPDDTAAFARADDEDD
jgi:putative DNA primase/helicase